MEEVKKIKDIQEAEEIKIKPSRLRIVFKIAFICNIFFIVCMILRYSNALQYIPQPLIELSIILGWSAMYINLLSFVVAVILI